MVAGTHLEQLPRRGWVAAPSPIEEHATLASALGLPALHIKRDDLIPALCGGSKVRKLDHLLAVAPWRDAPRWISAGAIGSGHLLTLATAADLLGRRLVAHVFWKPLGPGVVDTLAGLASGPVDLHYHRGRRGLVLRAPATLFGRGRPDRPVVPPGATVPEGMLGMVRAGVELAAQVRAGLLPEPRRIYVPLGSGGMVAGLSVGLALGGLRSEVRAVAVVEWALAMRGRLTRLQRALLAHLASLGVAGADGLVPVTVRIDRRQLGRGYGVPTDASLAAVARFSAAGIPLEAVYTGKAAAALLDEATSAGGPVLFWKTNHRTSPAPATDWRARLPPALARRLARALAAGAPSPGRRRALGAGLVAAVAGLGWRLRGGYPTMPSWNGRVLSAREATIVAAAVEALVAPPTFDGPAAAHALDAYLALSAPAMTRDVHALLWLVEQGTPLGLRLRRFTSLSVDERRALVAALGAHGGRLEEAAAGLRDLAMLAAYAGPTAWPALGYGGPMPGVALRAAVRWPAYEALRAPPGARPRGWKS